MKECKSFKWTENISQNTVQDAWFATNFKCNKKVTESDHAKVELNLNIQYTQAKIQRTEAFNFKSKECQNYFKDLTTNTNKFTMCFNNTEKFPQQIKMWQRNLKRCITQSFPKIRSRKRKFEETKVGELLEERKRIKIYLFMVLYLF